MAEVRFENLTKNYGNQPVIRDFSMTVADGEFVTVVGPSGCGKSTLLRCIAGLETVTRGDLLLDGRRVNDVPAQNRGIAMVFQSYALFPHMTVAANIVFGLKIRKVAEQIQREKLNWVLDLLHLDGLDARYPRELSGGQRQRVAIGRALVLEPGVLLLDEPLSNLDAKLRQKMRTEFKRLHKAAGRTTIYVTHDQVEAMTLSDRIAVLHDGTAQQIGTPDKVYHHPANRFTADFIGNPPMNFIMVALTHDQERLWLDARSFRLDVGVLPEKLKAHLLRTKSDRMVMGIRPQHLGLAHSAEQENVNSLQAIIDVMEPLGDRLIAVVSAGPHTLKAALPCDARLRVDTCVTLSIDPCGVHVFDADTGIALGR